jgi:hypothetical protein
MGHTFFGWHTLFGDWCAQGGTLFHSVISTPVSHVTLCPMLRILIIIHFCPHFLLPKSYIISPHFTNIADKRSESNFLIAYSLLILLF